MAEELKIQITSSFDTAPLKAGIAQAASAVAAGGQQMQSAFERVAQASLNNAAAQKNLNATVAAFSGLGRTTAAEVGALADMHREAAVAALELAAAQKAAKASIDDGNGSMRGFTSATGEARVEMAALSGSAGSMANGLARIAGQTAGLAPLIQAAFPVFAVGAFSDIIFQMGERVYHAYQNVILLKAALDALNKTAESEAQKAASLNFQYEESVARRLIATGHFKEAIEELKKAAGDKPLELIKLDPKIVGQFGAEFASFLTAVHTSADAPSVITRINHEAEDVKKQLADVKGRIADLSSGDTDAIGGSLGLTKANKLAEDLQKKLDILETAVGQVQSQTGIAANNLESSIAGIGKKKVADPLFDAEKQALAWQQILNARERLADGIAKIAERTSSLTDKEEDKQFKSSLKHLSDDIEARKKYSEETVKADELAALKGVDAQQKTIAEQAKVEAEKVNLSTATARQKIKANEAINQKEIEDQRTLEDQKLAISLDAVQKQIALLESLGQGFSAATASPEQLESLRRLYSQIEGLTAEHNAKLSGLANQAQQSAQKAADATQKSFQTIFNPVNTALDQMTKGILQGTQTIRQAFTRMGADIVASVINSLAQAALKWAEHFIIVNILEKSATAQRIESFLSGEAVKRAAASASNTADIIGSAGVGAAATYASVLMALPFPANVAAAPAAALTSFGAISSFAIAGSAAGGAVLPEDMLIQAHKNEMIIPARISQGLQSVIAAGQVGSSSKGNGAGGGDTHNHYWSVSAHDGPSTADFFKRNQGHVEKLIKSSIRNGKGITR